MKQYTGGLLLMLRQAAIHISHWSGIINIAESNVGVLDGAYLKVEYPLVNGQKSSRISADLVIGKVTQWKAVNPRVV
jgi:hypothetical protein